MINRILIFASSLFIFYCLGCKNKSSASEKRYYRIKEGIDTVDKNCKKEIDSLGFQHIDENAKFLIYLQNATERPLCDTQFQIGTDIYLCFLELKRSYVNLKHDTLTLGYNFVYNDTLPICICSKNPKVLCAIAYNIQNKKPIGFVEDYGYYKELDSVGNFVPPSVHKLDKLVNLQIEKLNPWFKSQLKQKGLIND